MTVVAIFGKSARVISHLNILYNECLSYLPYTANLGLNTDSNFQSFYDLKESVRESTNAIQINHQYIHCKIFGTRGLYKARDISYRRA